MSCTGVVGGVDDGLESSDDDADDDNEDGEENIGDFDAISDGNVAKVQYEPSDSPSLFKKS